MLDKHKQPLMPCHPARARQLLRKGRGRVHRLYPFTIRLTDREAKNSEVEGVTVKVDPGSKFTGVAVVRVTEDDATEGLYAVEVQHRGAQIRDKLQARAVLRRGRRSRNLRYRAPRLLNRTRPDGWLAPSVRHRVETTRTWIDRLRSIAPVTGLVQELVRFDLQRHENPEIAGTEYQQGTLAGYEVREYLLVKWDRKCAYCDTSGVPSNIDHIHPRSRGGSDRVSNLTLACIPCNQAKGSRSVEEFVTNKARLAHILKGTKAPLRDAAAINTTRWALRQSLDATGLSVTTGSGGRTKFNRARCGLVKSHTLDALAVGDLDSVGSFPASVLVAKAAGRGSYARTRSNQYGFPRLVFSRQKRHFGFATGDLVRAVVPTGKYAGTHLGRVAVRKTGSFNITTQHETVQGIHHRHCHLLARADGYGYTRKEEGVSPST